MATYFNEWCKDIATANLSIYKLSNDVILSLLRQTATTQTLPWSWSASFKRQPSSNFKLKILIYIKFWIC